MDNTNKSYNYHLDKSVLVFFLFAILAASSVFAYRYSTREICQILPFKIQAAEMRVGEFIRFTDQSIGAENWKWSFDDSTDVKTERNPYHTFKKPGVYNISLEINDNCKIYKTVSIKEKRFVLDSTKIPKIEAPRSIMVGETLEIEDNTNNAETWEWRFGETANVNSYDQKAEYVYKEAGVKTISLVVNGDSKHMANVKINVIPKPVKKKRVNKLDIGRPIIDESITYKPILEDGEVEDSKKEKKEEIKKAPYISNAKFGDKLVAISENESLPNELNEHFCNELNIPVIVNKKSVPFLVFCQKIRGKKITVNNVQIIRNKDTGCIKNVVIDLSKSLF